MTTKAGRTAAQAEQDAGSAAPKGDSAAHTIEDCRAAVEAWEAAQPMMLGCGCPVDAHPNDWDGWAAAHPDVWMGEKPQPGVGYVLRAVTSPSPTPEPEGGK